MLNKTFKRINLIKNISIETGLSQNTSKKIVYDLIDIIVKIIATENLNLKNIGKFKKKFKKERKGRNPKTGQQYNISSRYVISFLPSKKLSKSINNSL